MNLQARDIIHYTRYSHLPSSGFDQFCVSPGPGHGCLAARETAWEVGNNLDLLPQSATEIKVELSGYY